MLLGAKIIIINNMTENNNSSFFEEMIKISEKEAPKETKTEKAEKEQKIKSEFEKRTRVLDESQFVKIVKSYLSKEIIKEKLGDLDKGRKTEVIEPVLTKDDQDKLIAYEDLKVEELPNDWEKQLLRKEELEKDQADYIQKKEELKGWTDIFGNQTPQEIQEKISKLEERPDISQSTWGDHKDRKPLEEYNQIKEELDGWKDAFKDQSPSEVEEDKKSLLEKYNSTDSELKEWQNCFPNQSSEQIKNEKEELTKKLNEWTQAWENKELSEVRKEWDNLKKRPDIPIKEKQWWDDYACRQPLAKTKLEREELIKEKDRNLQLEKENEDLWSTVERFLENGRIRKYILAKPVLNEKDAEMAIAEMLEEVERKWQEYLESDENKNIATKELKLDLIYDKEKRERSYQILNWIKEARMTLDYQTLLERWSEGKHYNKKYDFDGSLYLLGKYLEVKNKAVPIIISEVQATKQK